MTGVSPRTDSRAFASAPRSSSTPTDPASPEAAANISAVVPLAVAPFTSAPAKDRMGAGEGFRGFRPIHFTSMAGPRKRRP